MTYTNINDIEMFDDIAKLAEGAPIKVFQLSIGKGYKIFYQFVGAKKVQENITPVLIKNNQMGVVVCNKDRQKTFYLDKNMEVAVKNSNIPVDGVGLILLGNSKAQNTVKIPLSSVPLTEYELKQIYERLKGGQSETHKP